MYVPRSRSLSVLYSSHSSVTSLGSRRPPLRIDTVLTTLHCNSLHLPDVPFFRLVAPEVFLEHASPL